jgi:hypothetical protein
MIPIYTENGTITENSGKLELDGSVNGQPLAMTVGAPSGEEADTLTIIRRDGQAIGDHVVSFPGALELTLPSTGRGSGGEFIALDVDNVTGGIWVAKHLWGGATFG